jgi:hypothetical protein
LRSRTTAPNLDPAWGLLHDVIDPEMTPETVRGVIESERNKRWRVWTATVLLERLGVRTRHATGEDFDRLKPIRRRAARVLRDLWLEGVLYRQEAVDTRSGLREIKYVRPEDAPGVYLVPCEACGGPRLSTLRERGRVVEACERCRSVREGTRA